MQFVGRTCATWDVFPPGRHLAGPKLCSAPPESGGKLWRCQAGRAPTPGCHGRPRSGRGDGEQ